MTTSATASISSNCYVPHRGPDRGGAVGQDGDLHAGRQRASKLGQQGLDAVDDLDHICARLPLDIEDHRGGIVHPCRLLHVFGVVDRLGHIG